ncbi:MAG: hypothetical protein SOZ09_09835 [Eubacteriales bacterium]|nr:hypothetical protein [Eubacteriales bacterium]
MTIRHDRAMELRRITIPHLHRHQPDPAPTALPSAGGCSGKK